MRPTHLVFVSLLFYAVSAVGQAQSTESSAGHLHVEEVFNTPAADQVRATPYSVQESDQASATADDPIKAQSQSRKQLFKSPDAQGTASRSRPPEPSSDFRSDNTCLSIVSVLLVPDYPNSDSTHFAGYTTCVPAARFRVYTADEKR